MTAFIFQELDSKYVRSIEKTCMLIHWKDKHECPNISSDERYYIRTDGLLNASWETLKQSDRHEIISFGSEKSCSWCFPDLEPITQRIRTGSATGSVSERRGG